MFYHFIFKLFQMVRSTRNLTGNKQLFFGLCLVLFVPIFSHPFLWGQSSGVPVGQEKVAQRAIAFHKALVNNNRLLLRTFTSTKLRYQHSNGWVETQKEQLRNLQTGYLVYHSFFEDSLTVNFRNRKQSTLRFLATIDVSMQGKRNTYRLYVEEDWKKNAWLCKWRLYSRRATRR